MDSLPLLAYAEAARARDAALAQVVRHNRDWSGTAFAALPAALRGLADEFTPEDIKQRLTPMVGLAPHPNCYGPLIMRAVKEGLIEKTGRYGHSRLLASKKTAAPYYRRCA